MKLSEHSLWAEPNQRSLCFCQPPPVAHPTKVHPLSTLSWDCWRHGFHLAEYTGCTGCACSVVHLSPGERSARLFGWLACDLSSPVNDESKTQTQKKKMVLLYCKIIHWSAGFYVFGGKFASTCLKVATNAYKYQIHVQRIQVVHKQLHTTMYDCILHIHAHSFYIRLHTTAYFKTGQKIESKQVTCMNKSCKYASTAMGGSVQKRPDVNI
jgi:hypothetical protein